ncbi:MAG: 1-deoxy-D-xylulose-5-phosphate synthase [Dehalococcoidia bacterium]|nr:1-deoxy-D-xylulose-5-phosphate synthase [Dehalococcoidia bacterium]
MGGYLDKIQSPADLRPLTPAQRDKLAAEIREELISTVIQTGGHLASNLGAVELTIALHSVFRSPRDKLVWDVGHQAYVHKLLTGRRDRFSTLRQLGGLSGFPDPEESPHDAFVGGHAGNSVSAALGMATARDLAGQDYHVVAIIGDGAMTAGMVMEALNQAGHMGSRLIVVLNDNQMSISPNVGAISSSLNRLRLDRRYHRAKEDAEHLLEKVPLGTQVLEAGRRFKKGFKGLVIPTMIWEELGFTYMGPLDGHNIEEMRQAFIQAKEYRSKPTFIHVMTQKGKGYGPAEDDAVGFHGIAPNNGEKSHAPSYTKVFGETIVRIARENPKVVTITAAMQEGTGLNLMAKEMPDRLFDVGICEQHAVTFAAGLASQGFIPVIAIYSTFLQRAYDQVLHDVCIPGLPVVFCLDRGGITGEDGKTHQGLFDLSYLRNLPGLTVASPKDENELQHLLYTAVMAKRPMAIRYPRGAGLGVARDSHLRQLPIGQGELLRDGSDLAILAVGAPVNEAMLAAEQLSSKGIKCAVANARFIKPLDRDLIVDLARRTGAIITVEENVLAGGFGSAVVELLASERLNGVQVDCLGIPDVFVEHGSPRQLRAKYGLDASGIVERALQLLETGSSLHVVAARD